MTDRMRDRPRHKYVPSQLRACGHKFDDGLVCCASPENPIHRPINPNEGRPAELDASGVTPFQHPFGGGDVVPDHVVQHLPEPKKNYDLQGPGKGRPAKVDASGPQCECFPVRNELGLGPKPGEQTKATLNPHCPVHGNKQQPDARHDRMLGKIRDINPDLAVSVAAALDAQAAEIAELRNTVRNCLSEIRRLHPENAALREALEQIANGMYGTRAVHRFSYARDLARAAIKGTSDET